MRRVVVVGGFLAAVAGLTLLDIRSSFFQRVRLSEAQKRTDDGVTRLAVIGDSVAYGAGDESNRGIAGCLDRELASRGARFAPTANLGVNGARTRDVLRLLKSGYAQNLLGIADAVIVSVGGNDLYGDSPSRALAMFCADCAMQLALTRMQAVVHRIESINPSVRIILLGLYDPYRRTFLDRQVNLWDSRLIARFADDSAVDVVRIADIFATHDLLSPHDHFHPSAIGYALIAARIAPAL